METVHLITSCQVNAARHGLDLVAAFIANHTLDEISNPDYAYARGRALEILTKLDEAWQHLPTARTIGVG